MNTQNQKISAALDALADMGPTNKALDMGADLVLMAEKLNAAARGGDPEIKSAAFEVMMRAIKLYRSLLSQWDRRVAREVRAADLAR